MNSRSLLWLLLLILWIIFGVFVFRSCVCTTCETETAAAAAVVPVDDGCDVSWTAQDGSLFSSGEVANNFQFQRSSFSLPDVMRTDLVAAVDNITQHLSDNANRGLTVTGYYDSTESNGSALGNLGLARATAIKNLFTAKGIAGSRITTAAALAEDKCFRNDTLLTGGMLAFGDITVDDSRLAAIKSRLSGNPLRLYFATDSDNLNLNTQQRQDVSDLVYYLENVNTARLCVDGHTDNAGNRNYNLNLSNERAEFVKNYLRTNGGVPLARMDVRGFGPDKPIATNATNDGKSKNRRVEVLLKSQKL